MTGFFVPSLSFFFLNLPLICESVKHVPSFFRLVKAFLWYCQVIVFDKMNSLKLLIFVLDLHLREMIVFIPYFEELILHS